MVRKCETTKHRKQSKKGRTKKREKKQQQVTEQTEQKIPADKGLPPVTPEPLSEEARQVLTGGRDEMIDNATKPLSPARRAFQDL